jgi:hypothetical protein
MKPSVTLTRTGPGIQNIQAGLSALAGDRVLVGIPAVKNSRRALKGQKTPINNAQLMFILTHGSQLRKIPATPIIEPAINAPDNKKLIMGHLKNAAKAELDGDHATAMEWLQKAGMAGSNAAKRWFTDPRNGWPPNKDSTINRKLGKLSSKRREAAIDQIVAQNGDTTGVVTRNIMTGQVRRAITYVVDEGNQSDEHNGALMEPRESDEGREESHAEATEGKLIKGATESVETAAGAVEGAVEGAAEGIALA